MYGKQIISNEGKRIGTVEDLIIDFEEGKFFHSSNRYAHSTTQSALKIHITAIAQCALFITTDLLQFNI